MGERAKCPTIEEYVEASRVLVKTALEAGNGEMLRGLRVVLDFAKDRADAAERLQELLGHYRAKRRVDGGVGHSGVHRLWNASKHLDEDEWIEANDPLAAEGGEG